MLSTGFYFVSCGSLASFVAKGFHLNYDSSPFSRIIKTTSFGINKRYESPRNILAKSKRLSDSATNQGRIQKIRGGSRKFSKNSPNVDCLGHVLFEYLVIYYTH